MSRVRDSVRVLAVEHFMSAIWVAVFGLVVADLFPSYMKGGSHLGYWYIYGYVAVASMVGCFCLLAGRSASKGTSFGKRMAEIAVVLFVIEICADCIVFAYFGYAGLLGKFGTMLASFPVFWVILSVFLTAFLVSNYLWLAYIDRARLGVANANAQASGTVRYHESTFPYNPKLTSDMLLVGALVAGLLFAWFMDAGVIGVAFAAGPLLLCFFVLQLVFNHRPSSFEKGRELVRAWNTGGKIFLFGEAWPFFRVLLYKDGLEVRAIFQRYFIPYDMLEKPLTRPYSSSRRLWLVTDIPGVPQDIRLYGSNIGEIRQMLLTLRGRG
ncbi:MAG: hypothetical protein OEV59_07710 [Deltaproteobacteria bacterium]|nr:hypothetical protein [Deltaproteobacteria bacterium]